MRRFTLLALSGFLVLMLSACGNGFDKCYEANKEKFQGGQGLDWLNVDELDKYIRASDRPYVTSYITAHSIPKEAIIPKIELRRFDKIQEKEISIAAKIREEASNAGCPLYSDTVLRINSSFSKIDYEAGSNCHQFLKSYNENLEIYTPRLHELMMDHYIGVAAYQACNEQDSR